MLYFRLVLLSKEAFFRGIVKHLYSETTCIKRPLCDVPKVSVQYILTSIQRPPVYKGHYEVVLAWPFNTGFTVWCGTILSVKKEPVIIWLATRYMYCI